MRLLFDRSFGGAERLWREVTAVGKAKSDKKTTKSKPTKKKGK